VALSFSQPVEAFESNTVATLNILECIRFAGAPVRLFNAISSDCFGDTEGPATETAPLRPKSPYAIAKAAAYWASRMYREAYGMHVCCGILSNHESPLRPERFVIRKIVSAACRIAAGAEETLKLGNTGIMRDWGYTPDYIEAGWRLMQSDAPDDFLIATGESHTLADFASAIFAEAGLDARAHIAFDETLSRPLDPQSVRLDPGKIARVLGWRARTGMRALAGILVAAERAHAIGPLPWERPPR
jgi:GDPmannose 4,6-dehydratase